MRWALFEAAQAARRTGSPDREYYQQAAERLGIEPCLPGDRAQAAQAQLPHAARARRGGAAARLNPMMRAQPFITPCTAAGSRPAPAATHAWTALKDRAAATLPAGSPHHPSCRRPGATPGRGPRSGWAPARTHPFPLAPARRLSGASRSALRAAQAVTGRRRRRSTSSQRSHPRPTTTATRAPRLTGRPCTDKEQRADRCAPRIGPPAGDCRLRGSRLGSAP